MGEERKLKMSVSGVLDASEISDAEMDAELEKGYADMKAGRTKSAESVFADIKRDYSESFAQNGE